MEVGEHIPLAPDAVHCWCVSLDVAPEACARLAATLASDERDRRARLRFERDRQRFTAAHGTLRELLGRYLGIPSRQVRLVRHAFGKPALSPEHGRWLKFNLSHSSDLALIAITTDAEVGVDVECVRPQPDYADIARSFFSATEVEALTRLPGHLRAEAFFTYWTTKEACLKAGGTGLAEFAGPPDRQASGRRSSVYTFQPAPGYVGAVAIEGSARHFQLRRWQSGIQATGPAGIEPATPGFGDRCSTN